MPSFRWLISEVTLHLMLKACTPWLGNRAELLG